MNSSRFLRVASSWTAHTYATSAAARRRSLHVAASTCRQCSWTSEEQVFHHQPRQTGRRYFSSCSSLLRQRRAQSSVAALMEQEEESSSLDEPSLTPTTSSTTSTSSTRKEVHRLERIRNVGILAHVDAGKTTVTERMLALAGVVRHVGRVDNGTTVTDYLPQERERGITIQSAAIQFDWGWHNTNLVTAAEQHNERVHIHLIDTPGHVDFSVEVHRSVAVLDGAVLVVDAVAGVQAQTETVWKAMQDHSPSRQALPSLVAVNKMDKEGCSFDHAITTIQQKLPHANPIAIQVPLFRVNAGSGSSTQQNCLNMPDIVADTNTHNGEFCGVIDLIHMRAIVYPETNCNSSRSVDECIPDVFPLLLGGNTSSSNSNDVEDFVLDPDCPLTQAALEARYNMVEFLAGECGDTQMEEYYLQDRMPSPQELQSAMRQATLTHQALPVVATAALRGKGLEPLLDAIADLLPSPLDRPAPALMMDDDTSCHDVEDNEQDHAIAATTATTPEQLGHPMNDQLLAFAFKVCHLSGGRGGSGDGRVVFCRVYSGTLQERDVLQVVSPPTLGEEPSEPRKERVGGLLELAGGAFTKKEHGKCRAGDVCALVGLKTVVTGDTLVLAPKNISKKHAKKHKNASSSNNSVCLAGVASPKPVLQVRLEAETQGEQSRLSECLKLLAIEDPSLLVEETEAGTLLSGLGELHVEVTLDRLHREFGLVVQKGTPRVAYRETIRDNIGTDGLLNFDRTMGDTRLQAAVSLRLEPTVRSCQNDMDFSDASTRLPLEPTIQVSPQVLQFLQVKPGASHEDCMLRSPVYKALVQGCLGSLKRGPVGSYAMANITCHVDAIDAEDGLPGLQALPGAMRAAAMNAVATTLKDNVDHGRVLEPTMGVEISVPNDMVGTVLSDLTSRRGSVGDVITGDESSVHQKTLVRGQVPLVEILGYANELRSLTAGEGTFSAEYKGHSVCSEVPTN